MVSLDFKNKILKLTDTLCNREITIFGNLDNQNFVEFLPVLEPNLNNIELILS